jgi:hypothetical protein
MSEAKIDEFPCIYPARREFPVFRDGFARDCLLQQRVNKLSVPLEMTLVKGSQMIAMRCPFVS